MTENYFEAELRRERFALAVAAYKANPNDESLTFDFRGKDVSVVSVCNLMTGDSALMPEALARKLSLTLPTTYARGAELLRTYVQVAKAPAGWVRP